MLNFEQLLRLRDLGHKKLFRKFKIKMIAYSASIVRKNLHRPQQRDTYHYAKKSRKISKLKISKSRQK